MMQSTNAQMNPQNCLNDFMTVEEVATARGYSTMGVIKAIKRKTNKLKAKRKGRQWLVHKEDYVKWKESSQ